MSLRSRAPLLVLAALVLAIAGVIYNNQSNQANRAERARLAKSLGAIPLNVEAPRVTLFNRAEQPVPLESYRGRLVFVNFWATWCGPCVAEMPSLIALQASLDADDIAFVSIAEDDIWAPVDAYLKRSPLPFDVFRDRPPRVEIPFETKSYPTSFLIDRDGRAVYRFNGTRNWDSDAIRELFALHGVAPR